MRKTIGIDVLVIEAMNQLHESGKFRQKATDYEEKADAGFDSEFWAGMAKCSRRYSHEAYMKFEILESLLCQELGEDFNIISYYYDNGLDENENENE